MSFNLLENLILQDFLPKFFKRCSPKTEIKNLISKRGLNPIDTIGTSISVGGIREGRQRGAAIRGPGNTDCTKSHPLLNKFFSRK